MFDDLDTEGRHSLARGALEGLTQLIEHQRPDEGPSVGEIAPLLRVITEMVKEAMPKANRPRPTAFND